MNQPLKESKSGNDNDNIPFWRVALSVMQASFGVQSNNNRERDFAKGRLVPFVVAALLFTAAFVISLIVIVQMVLSA